MESASPCGVKIFKKIDILVIVFAGAGHRGPGWIEWALGLISIQIKDNRSIQSALPLNSDWNMMMMMTE